MSIIPGMEERAPERTETSSGSFGSPKRLPAVFSTRASASSTSRAHAVERRAPAVVRADRRVDREARRNRNPERRHLREARALAAERVLAEPRPFRLAVAEKIDLLHFSTTISEKSASRENSFWIAPSSASRFCRSSGSGAIDEHFDEEPVERRRERGDRLHGVAVAARGGQLADRLPRLQEVRRELALGVLPIEAASGSSGGLLAEDVRGSASTRESSDRKSVPPRLGERGRPIGRVREVPDAGAEDRRDLVVGVAATLEQVAQPLGEERLELRQAVSGARGRPAGYWSSACARDGRPVAPPLPADDDRDDPGRGPAQAVGVARARRHEAQAKEPGEGVEPVRERENRSGRLARRISRPCPTGRYCS